jgi:hypothetical protein
VFSEVGSECFEKRLEDDTTEKEFELEKAISENPPSNHPNQRQQQWMKELLFMTAESKDRPDATDSVISEIGSTSFDKRVDNCSVMNSPRSTTPLHTTSLDMDDNDIPQMRTKRMRFQDNENYVTMFSVLGEHRPWCPWITQTVVDGNNKAVTDGNQKTVAEGGSKGKEGGSAIGNGDTTSDLIAAQTQYKRVPGWRVVLGVVLPSFRVNSGSITSSPGGEAWRSVRSVLHDCVSTASLD